MDAWRTVGLGLGIVTTACFVDFEDRPVYEVDTATTSSTSASNGSASDSTGNSSNSSNSSNSASSGGGSSSNSNSSSNGSGGTGGDATSSASNTGGSSAGGSSASNGSGGSPSTTNGSAGDTVATSGGGSGGAPGAVDDCEGADASCSACNNVYCASATYCCGDVSFFAAQALPEWIEMPELVTGYDERNTVTLSTSFTGDSQVAAVAYLLDYDMYMLDSLDIDATVSGGWTLTVSLEDRISGSGCVYTTGNLVELYDIPDNCWGDYDGYLLAPYDISFNQINVRLESVSSGAGAGSLTIHGMTLI